MEIDNDELQRRFGHIVDYEGAETTITGWAAGSEISVSLRLNVKDLRRALADGPIGTTYDPINASMEDVYNPFQQFEDPPREWVFTLTIPEESDVWKEHRRRRAAYTLNDAMRAEDV
jgi:hypothetical protein